jgi:hypothetical protein
LWAALFSLILFVRQREGLPAKASMLDFSAILENALAMRPDTNIVGGSVRQDFDLDLRLDYTILKARVGGGKIISYN